VDVAAIVAAERPARGAGGDLLARIEALEARIAELETRLSGS
jgi:hypothetical protein